MTNRISAAGNILMDIDPGRWRLIDNGGLEEEILAEAAAGHSLQYSETFGTTRRLPGRGSISVELIRQVVLGWSTEDESWHLGLLLGQELAEARSSRWCALAYWPDPETTQFVDIAQNAGKALANTLSIPFNYIPAQPKELDSPPPLPELPLSFGDWVLNSVNANTLEFQLRSDWSRGLILRALWYGVLAVAYTILAVATLTSPIAQPRPEILGYLGLVVAVLLIGIVVYTLLQTTRTVRVIQIDSFYKSIRGLNGENPLWNYAGKELTGVYVTQVADSGSRRRAKAAVAHGEINLQLYNGKFFKLVQHEQIDEAEPIWAELMDGVSELTPDTAHSNLQNAALHIARALDLPVYYDHRGRTR